MGNYRKILVAYDGSAAARSALAAAAALAREEKSWVKVVAVVPVYEGDLELIGVRDIKGTIAGPGREILDGARRAAEEEGVHILTDLEQGEPYARIVHVADAERCDLVILGRRGVSHLERELMGSVTARVIGHTDRDVLVLPKDTTLSWGSILLAVDDTPQSEDAVALAISLAGRHGSRLTAVSVVYTNDEFLALAPAMVSEMIEKARAFIDGIRKRAKEAGVEASVVVKEGEPYQAITALAAELPADVIVMGSHGRRGLRKMLMGSVTERTIGYAPCPVLVRHQGPGPAAS